MNTLLVLLFALQAPPVMAGETLTSLPALVQRCEQRPMMGDPHGPPSVCVQNDQALYVVKHGSCGGGCRTHEPVHAGARPEMKVAFGFACPQSVKLLSYRMVGWQRRAFVARDETESSLFETRDIRPFSAEEVEAACAKALGGSWQSAGKHANSKPTVEVRLEKTIEVYGECAGSAEKRQSRGRLQLVVTCEDDDF